MRRLLLLAVLLAPFVVRAQTPGQTATQAIITYTAGAGPNTVCVATAANPCDAATQHPQLSTTLFGAGANQDCGVGQLPTCAPGLRYFVVGQRTFAIETQTSPISVGVGACTTASTTFASSPAQRLVTCTGVSNTFVQGDIVTTSGLGSSSGTTTFNVNRQPVVAATGTTFTYYLKNTNTSGAADTSTGTGSVQRFNAYSIASLANTTYNYSLSGSCTSGCTGSFTTTNVPQGNAFAEAYPVDFTGLGEPVGTPTIPTLPQFTPASFASTQVANCNLNVPPINCMSDPFTGVLVKNFIQSPFDAGNPQGMGVSASIHRNDPIVTNGGYHLVANDGSGQLYWLQSFTGETRYLGLMNVPGNGVDTITSFVNGSSSAGFDATNANRFYIVTCTNSSLAKCPGYDATDKAAVVRVDYTGNDTGIAYGPAGGTNWTHAPPVNMTPFAGSNTLSDQLVTFTAGDPVPFNPAQYNKGFNLAATAPSPTGTYLFIDLTRQNQGSPAWKVVFDTGINAGSGGVVAAFKLDSNYNFRWTGSHGLVWNNSPFMQFGNGNLLSGQQTMGPFLVSYTGTGLTACSGIGQCNGVTLSLASVGTPSSPGVAGDPVSNDTSSPPDGGNFDDIIRAGDHMAWCGTHTGSTCTGTGNELMIVVAASNSVALTSTSVSGGIVTATCAVACGIAGQSVLLQGVKCPACATPTAYNATVTSIGGSSTTFTFAATANMTAGGTGGSATATGAGTGSHTNIVVNRGARFIGTAAQQVPPTMDAGGIISAHSTSEQIMMASSREGNGATFLTGWWDTVNDPHGVDATGTFLYPDYSFSGGHGGQEKGYQVVEGPPGIGGFTQWGERCASGATISCNPSTQSFGVPYLRSQTETVGFAYVNFNGTANGKCFGSQCTHYPGSMDHALTSSGNSSSLDVSTQPWFMDSAAYSGDAGTTTTALATGAVHVRKLSFHTEPFDRTVPFHAENGLNLLTNASAPSFVLPDTGTQQLCVVFQAGECWAGSAVGEVYADILGSASNCSASESGVSASPDFCGSNMPNRDQAVSQFQLVPVGTKIGNDNAGNPFYGYGNSRQLVTAWVGPPRFSEMFDHVDSTGQWLLFDMALANPNLLAAGRDYNSWNRLMAARIPPAWTSDGIDRTKWESPSIPIGTAAGATHAAMQYGYEENGLRTLLRCAQYAATCYYSGTSTPVFSVGAAASLALNSNVTPAIEAPQRVLFYNIVYLDGSNNQVGQSGILPTVSGDQSSSPGPPAAPHAPTGLTVTGTTTTTISLGWTAPPGSFTGYTVYRATVHGGPYATITSGLTSPSFTNTGLAAGTYFYVVTAFNGGIVSSISGNGTTATLTCTAACPFTISSTINIQGSSVAAFNGAFTVTGQPSSTTVTFASASSSTGTGGGVWQTGAESANSNEASATVPPVATVTLLPASLTFGSFTVGTTSPSQSVTLTNTSSAGTSVTVSSIAITGTNSGDFAQSNNCPAALAQGASCTITVTFTPLAAGARSASVSVTDSASGSPHTVALSGTGLAQVPAATLSPTSLTFGGQLVSTPSVSQPVTVTNTGTGTLVISSISFTGTNAADFSETDNCVGSLAVNASCTINVTFTPGASGVRTGTLNVNDNAANTPQTAALTGTGITTRCQMTGGAALSGAAVLCP